MMSRYGLMVHFLAIISASVAISVAADTPDVTAAIASDDECQSSGDAGCSLNALQTQQSKVTENSSPDDVDQIAPHGNESVGECKGCSQRCADYQTYGDDKDCNSDDDCKVVVDNDDSDKWWCTCADDQCTPFEATEPEEVEPAEALPDAHEQNDPNGSKPVDASSDLGMVYMPRTLYHTTSPHIAHMILKGNFKAGHGGWCGGAIYFIGTPHLPRSKYGSRTKNGAIIQTTVNMGNICYFDKHCRGIYGVGTWAAKRQGCNSIMFNPGDGWESIIWNPSQVMAKKLYR